MNHTSSAVIIMVVFLMIGSTAIAEIKAETKTIKFALSSPGCDATKLKLLSKGALTTISKQQNWANQQTGYIVSLDTTQMTNVELVMKMREQHCFVKKKQ